MAMITPQGITALWDKFLKEKGGQLLLNWVSTLQTHKLSIQTKATYLFGFASYVAKAQQELDAQERSVKEDAWGKLHESMTELPPTAIWDASRMDMILQAVEKEHADDKARRDGISKT